MEFNENEDFISELLTDKAARALLAARLTVTLAVLPVQ